MKTLSAFLLVALALTPLRAQLFRPETVNGAIFGGIAGAILGHNSGSLSHNAWRGAVLGSVAGALIGSSFGDSRDDRAYGDRSVGVTVGYGYGYRPRYAYAYDAGLRYNDGDGPYGRSRDYVDAAPFYYAGSSYWNRDYATSGLLLGGLTGAMIGHNGHFRNSWRGAAVGSIAGFWLGSIADVYSREQVVNAGPIESAPTAPVTLALSSPQKVTTINHYRDNGASNSMTAVNGMFGR